MVTLGMAAPRGVAVMVPDPTADTRTVPAPQSVHTGHCVTLCMQKPCIRLGYVHICLSPCLQLLRYTCTISFCPRASGAVSTPNFVRTWQPPRCLWDILICKLCNDHQSVVGHVEAALWCDQYVQISKCLAVLLTGFHRHLPIRE